MMVATHFLILLVHTLSWERSLFVDAFASVGIRNSLSFKSPLAAVSVTNPTSSDAFVSAFAPPDIMGDGEISEKACADAASLMECVSVPVPESVSPEGSVAVTYVHWPADPEVVRERGRSLPLLLVHGFDSSCLEYRRLGPLLASAGIDSYAVDILGWGFGQMGDSIESFSADAKVATLAAFWETINCGAAGRSQKREVCVVGASLGGAAAIEFAEARPDVAKGLILIDAQGFVDGVGPMSMLPKPLAQLGVKVLKSVPLRNSANQMSYYDPKTFATDDALKIGRLHCQRAGWNDALVSFMLSGGFSPTKKVSKIEVPSLVLWGREDTILEKKFATQFLETLPDGELQWIEECGHVPHLEQPKVTTDAIAEFLRSDKFQDINLPAVANDKGGNILEMFQNMFKP